MAFLLQVVLLVVGFVMLVKGADWFVGGAAKIADKFGIPHLIVGLTIVAMGTSAPETAVSISASLKGGADIAVGNVLGSNILNVLIILGITAVIHAISVQTSTVRYEIPFCIFISVLLVCLGLFDGGLSRIDGVILWAFMITYLMYLLYMVKKGKENLEEEDTVGNVSGIVLAVMVVGGGAMIVLGANVTVNAATEIATMLGMSQRLIGLTIVALGTSLPELMASVTAARKGNSDIAIGNILGSNIFNILFVLGTSALITPVSYTKNFTVDSIVCVCSVVILLLCVLPKKKLNRTGGVVLLAGYVAYFVYLLV